MGCSIGFPGAAKARGGTSRQLKEREGPRRPPMVARDAPSNAERIRAAASIGF